MVTILVAIALHHGKGFMAGDSFHCWQVNLGLHQVCDCGVSQCMPHYLGRIKRSSFNLLGFYSPPLGAYKYKLTG